MALAGVWTVVRPVTSLEDLFDQEYERLVRALAVAFGPESAADAVQEAFIQADLKWRRIARYGDPAGWVRRVAINRLNNGRRDDRRRRQILGSLPILIPPTLTDEQLDLRQAVDALPERQRSTVCLYYLADLTVDEVAAALQIAPGTVKSTLHHARHRLRRQLEERHA